MNLSSYHLKARYAFELEARPCGGPSMVDVCVGHGRPSPGQEPGRDRVPPAGCPRGRPCGDRRDRGDPRGSDRPRCDGRGAARRSLNGGEFPAYPTLVDARGTLHGTPIGKILGKGDTVYIEVSGVVRRYHCNISRTIVVGEPSKEVRELYALVKDALTAPPRRWCRGPR